jgi:hypothetical protein
VKIKIERMENRHINSFPQNSTISIKHNHFPAHPSIKIVGGGQIKVIPSYDFPPPHLLSPIHTPLLSPLLEFKVVLFERPFKEQQ